MSRIHEMPLSAKCEGCGQPATHITADDVELCADCYFATPTPASPSSPQSEQPRSPDSEPRAGEATPTLGTDGFGSASLHSACDAEIARLRSELSAAQERAERAEKENERLGELADLARPLVASIADSDVLQQGFFDDEREQLRKLHTAFVVYDAAYRHTAAALTEYRSTEESRNG